MILEDDFPIKIQIPLSFSINANISFTSFRFLEDNEKNIELFEIPEFLFSSN